MKQAAAILALLLCIAALPAAMLLSINPTGAAPPPPQEYAAGQRFRSLAVHASTFTVIERSPTYADAWIVNRDDSGSTRSLQTSTIATHFEAIP